MPVSTIQWRAEIGTYYNSCYKYYYLNKIRNIDPLFKEKLSFIFIFALCLIINIFIKIHIHIEISKIPFDLFMSLHYYHKFFYRVVLSPSIISSWLYRKKILVSKVKNLIF